MGGDTGDLELPNPPIRPILFPLSGPLPLLRYSVLYPEPFFVKLGSNNVLKLRTHTILRHIIDETYNSTMKLIKPQNVSVTRDKPHGLLSTTFPNKQKRLNETKSHECSYLPLEKYMFELTCKYMGVVTL